MAHLSQLMNGMVRFICSLISCSPRHEECSPSQDPTGPTSYDLGRLPSLSTAGVPLPSSCQTDVLCPSQRRALGKWHISLPHGTNAPIHGRQATSKAAIASALGCARYLGQRWIRCSTPPRHGLCSPCNSYASPGQGQLPPCAHPETLQGTNAQLRPLCICTPAPPGNERQQWSWCGSKC